MNTHQWWFIRLWLITIGVDVAVLAVLSLTGVPFWVLIVVAGIGLAVLVVQVLGYADAKRRSWPRIWP